MNLLRQLSHALLISLIIPIAAKALDPFYSDEDWNKLRSAYLKAEPPNVSQPKTHPPVGLVLETTRLSKFELYDATLPDALQELRAQFSNLTDSPFPECLLTAAAATSSARISLKLNDVSALECLRFIGQNSGHHYSVADDKLIFGRRANAPLNPWNRLQFFNLPLSEALAHLWFSDAKKAWHKNDFKPWRVEAFLDEQGVPFPQGTQAVFVPSMNVLPCVQGDFALPALQTLIAEAEARLHIEGHLKNKDPLPSGMELRSLKPNPVMLVSLSKVCARSGKYLEPRHATTQDILSGVGVQFPKGSSAWFDPASSQLHVINTPEQLTQIDTLCKQP